MLGFVLENEEVEADIAGINTDEVYATEAGIFYVTIDEDGLRTLHAIGIPGDARFPRLAVVIEEDFLVFPHWEIPVRQFAIDLGITTTTVTIR